MRSHRNLRTSKNEYYSTIVNELYLHTFSAFMVADVTINFKSRLRDKTIISTRQRIAREREAIYDSLLRNKPIRTSVLSDRS